MSTQWTPLCIIQWIFYRLFYHNTCELTTTLLELFSNWPSLQKICVHYAVERIREQNPGDKPTISLNNNF